MEAASGVYNIIAVAIERVGDDGVTVNRVADRLADEQIIVRRLGAVHAEIADACIELASPR